MPRMRTIGYAIAYIATTLLVSGFAALVVGATAAWVWWCAVHGFSLVQGILPE